MDATSKSTTENQSFGALEFTILLYYRQTIMTEAYTTTMQESSQPRPIPERTILQIPPTSLPSLPPPSSASRIRISHLNLDTFSPVNQNGSFEFDRVLKSGYVQKRTRKTKVEHLQAFISQPSLLIPTYRLGNRYFWFCALTPCRYTKTKTRIN